MRLLFPLIVLVTATFVHAEPPTYGPWRSSSIGGGGWIQNVVIAPSNPDRMYAYVDVGGVFRSDDGGATWRIVHKTLGNRRVRSLDIDPRNPDRIILVNGSSTWVQGVFISDDGGETWRQTLRALFEGNGAERATGVLIARSPQNPDLLLVAAVDTGVWRSTDNGETWTNIPGTENRYPADLRFDRADPSRVYLACVNWQWRDRHRPPAFFRSDDAGQSFSKLSDRSPTELIHDPTDPNRIFAIFGYATIETSTDGGETWTDASRGLPVEPARAGEPVSEHRFSALAAGPDFLLTASTRGTFYRLDSLEGGWRRIERQSITQQVRGRDWFNARANRAPGDFNFFGAALGSITVHPNDPNRWFFTDWAGIYETRDAGANWTLRVDGIEVTVIHDLTQCPTDPAVVHLGMADIGYFHSLDGATTFDRVALPGGGNNIRAVATSAADPNRLVALGAGRSGHSWFSNQVFLSADRGQTWTRSPMTGLPGMDEQSPHRVNAVEIDPRDSNIVYLAVSGNVAPGSGGIYRSNDGGKSFEWFSQGLDENQPLYRAAIWGGGKWIAADAAGNLITLGRDVKRLYARRANESQWTRISALPDDEPTTVVADPHTPGRFYVSFTRQGLFRSDDVGQTWSHLLEGRIGTVTVDRRIPGRVAVAGTEQGTQISTDHGASFTPVGDEGFSIGIGAVLAFVGDRLVAGTDGNGAFWMPLNNAAMNAPVARPLAKAQPAAPVLPTLVNGDMSEGTDRPRAWTGHWTGEGKLRISRDTDVFTSEPASLKLESIEGRARGTVWQSVTVPEGASRFNLSGELKVQGPAIEFVEVVVQSFDAQGKQLKWENIHFVRASRDWHRFARNVTLPGGAARFSVVLSFTGEGAAWLDDVAINPAE